MANNETKVTPFDWYALAANDTKAMDWQDRFRGESMYRRVRAEVWCDQAGTLYLDHADRDDKADNAVLISVPVVAQTTAEIPWTNLAKRHYRLRLVNGSTVQTVKPTLVVERSGRPVGDTNVTGSAVTDAQAIPTRQAGTTNLATNAAIITAAQVELKAAATALVGRTQLILYPPDAGTIYWGPSGVTSATGAPLASTGQPVAFSLDPNTPLSLYAVNDGTNRTVKVVEAK